MCLVGIELVNYVSSYFVGTAALLTSSLSPPSSYMFLNPLVHFSCFSYPTNRHEVFRIIKRLTNKCHVLLLDISPALLEENSVVFSRQLSSLYNMSIYLYTLAISPSLGGSRQHKRTTKTMGTPLRSSSNDDGPSRVWMALLEQHSPSSPVFHNLGRFTDAISPTAPTTGLPL